MSGRQEGRLFTVNSLADLRTDGVKQVRIARRWNRQELCSVGDTLRAWSKSKTTSCPPDLRSSDITTPHASRVSPSPKSQISTLPLGEGKAVAFTLAEVLITLGIIGVVAALTMPSLIQNVTERVNSSRQANIAYKVTQATDKMKALGLLHGNYASTDAFVDELEKHLKIAKRCDAEHIADCWPTAKVTTGDGEEYEVKDAKRGKHLSIKPNKTDNVGLVLADGSAIILTYNQNSEGMDEGSSIEASYKDLPVGFGKTERFAYTTNTTGAIDFVMDVNGAKGPNSETINGKYYDIRSFKVAKFSWGCDVKIPGIGCLVNLGTNYECLEKGSDDQIIWDPKWSNSSYVSASCWGGAKKACADIGMSLPDFSTLQNIYNKQSDYSNLPQSGWVWSLSEIYNDNASVVNFGNGSTGGGNKVGQNSALCIR